MENPQKLFQANRSTNVDITSDMAKIIQLTPAMLIIELIYGA